MFPPYGMDFGPEVSLTPMILTLFSITFNLGSAVKQRVSPNQMYLIGAVLNRFALWQSLDQGTGEEQKLLPYLFLKTTEKDISLIHPSAF